MANGAADEPPETAGATVLAARALSEGTERYDAIGLVEASERLGASLHAEAGWDALSAGVEVPRRGCRPPSSCWPNSSCDPTFPEHEVERLREERLNDLLQARADPRRRAEEAYIETIYAPSSPYHRPSGGTRETVEHLGPAELRAAYERGLDPARATLIVAGEIGDIDVLGVDRAAVRRRGRRPPVRAPVGRIDDAGTGAGRVVRIIHRPGSVQTEIRVGHPGLPRRIPDFHAVVGDERDPGRPVQLAAQHATARGEGLHVRCGRRVRPASRRRTVRRAGGGQHRGDGPGRRRDAGRARTDARRTGHDGGGHRGARLPDRRLPACASRRPARSAGPWAASSCTASTVEELVTYRERIEAVDIDAITAAARDHLHIADAAIVLVGDADAFGDELAAAGLGPIVIERDDAEGASPAPGADRRRGRDPRAGRRRDGRRPDDRCRDAARRWATAWTRRRRAQGSPGEVGPA